MRERITAASVEEHKNEKTEKESIRYFIQSPPMMLTAGGKQYKEKQGRIKNFIEVKKKKLNRSISIHEHLRRRGTKKPLGSFC